jgi:hypothetical protein
MTFCRRIRIILTELFSGEHGGDLSKKQGPKFNSTANFRSNFFGMQNGLEIPVQY